VIAVTTARGGHRVAGIAEAALPNCLSGLPPLWSVVRRRYWCCAHRGLGCQAHALSQAPEVPHPYDCRDGLSAWSSEKKTWCCRWHRARCAASELESKLEQHGDAQRESPVGLRHPFQGRTVAFPAAVCALAAALAALRLSPWGHRNARPYGGYTAVDPEPLPALAVTMASSSLE